jgi:hypothetical protein
MAASQILAVRSRLTVTSQRRSGLKATGRVGIPTGSVSSVPVTRRQRTSVVVLGGRRAGERSGRTDASEIARRDRHRDSVPRSRGECSADRGIDRRGARRCGRRLRSRRRQCRASARRWRNAFAEGCHRSSPGSFGAPSQPSSGVRFPAQRPAILVDQDEGLLANPRGVVGIEPDGARHLDQTPVGELEGSPGRAQLPADQLRQHTPLSARVVVVCPSHAPGDGSSLDPVHDERHVAAADPIQLRSNWRMISTPPRPTRHSSTASAASLTAARAIRAALPPADVAGLDPRPASEAANARARWSPTSPWRPPKRPASGVAGESPSHASFAQPE